MNALDQLRRKARYGHRSYVYWYDADGALSFEPYGRAGIKRALLSVGGKGRFFWIDSAGNSNIVKSLSFAIHLWRCAPKHTS